MTSFKKILVSTFLLIFIITGTGFINVKPAKAQWTTFSIVDSAKWIWEKVGSALNFAALKATYRLTEYTAEYLAQQAAFAVLNELLSGESGGKPLFETKTASELFSDTLTSAAGDMIGDLTSEAGFEKFNFCAPSLAGKISLTLSLLDVEKPPAPKCDFKNVVNNWKKFGSSLKDVELADLLQVNYVNQKLNVSSYDSEEEMEKAYNEYFDTLFSYDTNELGSWMKAYTKVQEEKTMRMKTMRAEFAKCKGYKDKKTPISQKKKTGCEDIQKRMEASQDPADQKAVKAAEGEYIESLTWKGVPLALGNAIANASMTFWMTLSGQLAKFYIEKGLFGEHLHEDDDTFDNLVTQLRGGYDFYNPPRNYDVSKEINIPEFQKLPEYSLLTDYIVCPIDEFMRRADHCVISNEFLSLITKKKTIRGLIEEGLLDDSIIFISPDNPLHDEYDCYKSGFCYKNLVKLRKAGVLPVGWELAAKNSPSNNPDTLGDIIECFEDSVVGNPNFNCNVSNNPYYHLIDIDWVLKEPMAMCETLTYSNELLSYNSAQRSQYCADFKTCLEEDDDGNCKTGYGYCTRSENLWRFNGESCNELYAGCLIYDSKKYDRNSYIKSTLDDCTSDEAGCLRYSQVKDEDNIWVLDDIGLDENDLFFNKNIDTCSSDYDGCSEYIVMTPDINSSYGPNLIPNGDFELDNDEDLYPDEWYEWVAYGNTLSTCTSITENNTAELKSNPKGSCVLQQNITDLIFDTDYLLSADITIKEQVEGSVKTYVRCQYDTNEDGVYDDDPSGGYDDHFHDYYVEADIQNDSSQNISLIFNPYDESEGDKIHSCYATVRTHTDDTYSEVQFDNVQLRIVDSSVAEMEDVLNIPYTPYGDTRITLNSDRTMCLVEEINCQGYTSVYNDNMIPAIIDQDDLCPSECSNYESFVQKLSIFDTLESNYEIEYYNFIPETADSCPAQYVNCEEFTNLASQEEGGEVIEQYSFVRQCVDTNFGETYYTWEGSDVSGYQIQTWLALPSRIESGDGDNFGYAPCTNILADDTTCNDTVDNAAICGPETPADLMDDPEINPNCRKFFDTDGKFYWRLQDRLIFAGDNCHDYRRSNSGQVYKIMPNLSNSCPAKYNNCRAYKGNIANNLRIVFDDNFNFGIDNWNTDNGEMESSLESLTNDSRSIKLSTNNHSFSTSISKSLKINKDFELSWWMKNNGILNEIEFILVDENDNEVLYLGEIEDIAISNWKDYKIVLTNSDFNENDYSAIQDNLSLKLIVDGNDYIFIDNLILKETIDSVSIIKDSWKTPSSCDNPYTGYHLGCKEYFDTNDRVYNLKSFNNLCREDAIGCTGVINTHNSDNPFQEVYNSGDDAEITIPKDSIEYLVPDINKYCPSNYKGCMTLGLPMTNIASGEISDYGDISLINDPNKYENILCSSDGLYCDEFTISDNSSQYFKFPGERICEYKDNVTVGDQITPGWFEIDTEISCSADWAKICPAEQNLCTEFRDPNDLENCNKDVTDSNDPNYCEPEELDILTQGNYKSYYYFDNNSVDRASCDSVDQNSGCALFYNINKESLIYDSSQTYYDNQASGSPASPITCDDQTPPCVLDSNDIIKVIKDRECSEWLACKSITQVTDSNDRVKNICDSIGTCTEYNYEASDSSRSCAKWGDYTNFDEDIISKVSPLTIENYQDRIEGGYISWSDDEYLGYSIPDMFPVESFVVYNFPDTSSNPGPRLVVNSGVSCSSDSTDCSYTDDVYGYDFYGECMEDYCWINPKVGINDDNYHSIITRGYSMEEAPFPDTIIIPGTKKVKERYSGAVVCNSYKPGGCESKYQKVSYGLGFSQYLATDDTEPSLICTQGNVGVPCIGVAYDPIVEGSVNECDGEIENSGVCSAKSKIDTYYNLLGICAEYDDENSISSTITVDNLGTEDGQTVESRVSELCSQWYPVESISGTDSLYDNYDEAGYYNADGDLYFCSVGEAYTTREDRLYCGRFDSSDCNLLMLVPIGSKININKLDDYSALFESWVPGDQYNHYTNGSSQYSEVGAPIITPLSPGEDIKFTRPQFDDIVEDNLREYIIELFDASSSAPGKIKYFHYDENVKTDGSSDSNTNSSNNVYSEYYDTNQADPCWDSLCVNEACAISSTGDNTSMHLVRWSCSNGGWCSFSNLEDDCTTYWNPLTYNYYVQHVGGGAIGVEECTETLCDAPVKGVQCLRNSTRYSLVKDDDNITGADKEAVNCIEALDSDGDNDISTGEDYCSDYSSCYNEIFTDEGTVLVTSELSAEMFNEEGNACLQNIVPAPITCTVSGGTEEGGYPTGNVGTACTGIDCYQQCGQVVKVDSISDSTKTIVRTDIWWRSKNNTTTNIVDWSAYAYSTSTTSYSSSSLKYSEIGSTSLATSSNFGAAQNWDGALPIITEVPVGEVLDVDYYSSPVFFGTAYDDTLKSELKKLFYQVYNLEWTGDSYVDSLTEGLGDITNSYAGSPYNPKVYKLNCTGGSCTVGGEGITLVYDSIGNTTIKFYYYAHPDHMPIQYVGVDWYNNDNYIGTDGKYKNKLPTCDPTATMPHSDTDKQGFGGTAGACSENYKVFNYSYIYDDAYPCDETDGKPKIANTSCYKPSVKIIDWWDKETVVEYDDWVKVEE